jgi:glycerol-3-phosphate dehydrogenase
MQTEMFDVVVVGGGITGAGIALDAATRGLRVALVEMNDFASGTSSRTTKLIHGGLRYLAQFRFRLTREALSERTVLQQLAPHLVEPIPFLFPIYHKRFEVWRVNTGLWLYDLMAGLRRTRLHRRLGREETLRRAPLLNPDGLRASFVYYDARTDDARLVIEVLKTAVDYGSVVANYLHSERVVKKDGRASGILVHDRLSNQSFEVRARKVVLATGVWLDGILNAEDPDAPRRVRPAKGVHIIVPRERLGGDTALAFPTPDDRLMFVVPWQNATLIGTTDTDYDGPMENPHPSRTDLDYILEVVNAAFPGLNLSDADVLSIFAGLRPLIDSGSGNTASVSREDRVFERDDGTIAIAGGKLTTYRRMGRKVIDLVVRRMREEGQLEKKITSRTRDVLIGGFPERSRRRLDRLTRLGRLLRLRRRRSRSAAERKPTALSPDLARRLYRIYGANWEAIAALVAEDQSLGNPVIPGIDVLRAEVVFAVRHEMARTLLDVLARRTHVAMLDRDQARGAALDVAKLMARELAWDDAEIGRQIDAFQRDVGQYSVAEVTR